MRGKRARAVMLLAAGLAVGTMLTTTPATANIGGTLSHLVGHLKNTFYTKSQSNARFLPSASNNLAAGKTIRGNWNTAGKGMTTGDFVSDSISFGWRFPVAPTVHVIRAAGTPPAACPGTVTNPRAKIGHLCIYESTVTSNAGTLETYSFPDGAYNIANRFGTSILGRPAADNGLFYMAGTWAATAGTPAARVALRPASCPAGKVPAC